MSAYDPKVHFRLEMLKWNTKQASEIGNEPVQRENAGDFDETVPKET